MSALLQRLTNWRAYDDLRKNMQTQGFALHECYAKILAELCKCSKESLEDYWRESSREFVTSGGKTETNTRTFNLEGTYHSRLLDGLSASLPVTDPKERYLSLLPSLREIDRQRSNSSHVSELISAQMREAKFNEYADNAPIISDEFDTKKGQFNIFSIVAGNSGFVRKGNTLSKRSGALCMKITADLGGRRNPIGIQFSAQILCEDEPNTIFYVRPGEILPGIEYYTVYKGQEEGMHGLKAYCAFSNELFQSVEH